MSAILIRKFGDSICEIHVSEHPNVLGQHPVFRTAFFIWESPEGTLVRAIGDEAGTPLVDMSLHRERVLTRALDYLATRFGVPVETAVPLPLTDVRSVLEPALKDARQGHSRMTVARL